MKTLPLIALLAILLSGCAKYQSSITIGGATFKLPKDSKIGELDISIPTTNGVIQFRATNCTWSMNPAVINAATAHDAALISATAAAVGTVAGAVGSAMVKP